MRPAPCLVVLFVAALVTGDALATERVAAIGPVALRTAPDRLLPPDDARPAHDAALQRSCSATSPRQAVAACVSLAATTDGQGSSPVGQPLGLAYTQRFLPGFAVTVDRAPSMLAGFMTGLGRSLSQGRNCFAGACSFGPGIMLDEAGTLAAEAAQPAPLRRAVADPGELAALSMGYGWDIETGSLPVTLRASAAQLFDAPADSTRPAPGDGPRQTTTGDALGLSLQRGPFELGLVQQRLRIAEAASFHGSSDGSRVTRQELRLAWQLTSVRLSLVLAEGDAAGERDQPEASVRSAGLQFDFPLR